MYIDPLVKAWTCQPRQVGLLLVHGTHISENSESNLLNVGGICFMSYVLIYFSSEQ